MVVGESFEVIPIVIGRDATGQWQLGESQELEAIEGVRKVLIGTTAPSSSQLVVSFGPEMKEYSCPGDQDFYTHDQMARRIRETYPEFRPLGGCSCKRTSFAEPRFKTFTGLVYFNTSRDYSYPHALEVPFIMKAIIETLGIDMRMYPQNIQEVRTVSHIK